MSYLSSISFGVVGPKRGKIPCRSDEPLCRDELGAMTMPILVSSLGVTTLVRVSHY